MNERVKQLWVEALRSGEYKQCNYSLRRDESKVISYCCLGVLCELYAREHSHFDWAQIGIRTWLPVYVMHWAGLTKPDPEPKYGDHTLSDLNDRAGYNFEQIAEVIEKWM